MHLQHPRRLVLQGLVAGLLLLTVGFSIVRGAVQEPYPESDHRAWQHGVNLLKVGERLLLVWGSAGNPPKPNLGGDWPHDVYYDWLDIKASQAAKYNIQVNPKTLVSLPEAQEPPSVAINSKGTVLMTTEDGNGGINQNAGLWDSSLKALHKYPFMIRKGGHSGHAAALKDKFLVTYGEGWVDGGGWRGVGTGETIYARIVSNDGKLGPELKLSELESPRDGWPLVAASNENWMVIWQRYPEMALQSALINASGQIIKRQRIMSGMPLRYTYHVTFVPELSAYAVTGSSGKNGFITLVGLDGSILHTEKGLPLMAGESQLIVNGSKSLLGIYPIKPRGVAVVSLKKDAVRLLKVIDNPHHWDYAGTTGIFVAPDKALIATLSTSGLQVIPVDVSR